MAKVRFLKESQREFQKHFNSLCNSHSAWQVWSDFVVMSAIAIQNSVDAFGKMYELRENRYIQIISKYSSDEQKVFPTLFAIVVNALEENPDQDFLGELFMALELSSAFHGQFFTPYSLCKLMAEMQMSDIEHYMERNEYITVNDPACGAGALLVAARNQVGNKKYDWSTRMFVVAQDIDETAGLMCYIQLSLLGCAGYVCIADTICNPLVADKTLLSPILKEGQQIYYTPAFYLDIWQLRKIRELRPDAEQNATKIIEETPSHSEIPNVEEPHYDIKLIEADAGQFSLF